MGLTTALRLRAEAASERVAFTFLEDGETVSEEVTYGRLQASVAAFAARARDAYPPGTRALLLYPQGLDFLIAFLGCQLAGWVPVPVSLPNRQRGVALLGAVLSDCGAQCLLTTEAQMRRLRPILSTGVVPSSVPCWATDAWREGPPLEVEAPFDPEAPALLQYTSGSTGTPRGVVITHRNLAHNQAQIRRRLDIGPGARVVSWLPMFHDMGLGTVFSTVQAGGPCALMPPAAFLQKPVRWLRLISRYGATHSGGPDFAYDFCVRRVAPADCEGLDLSAWKCAYSGAEPVRASTLERFALTFAPSGFRAEGFTPVYGLAESTLIVSGAVPGAGYTVRRFSASQLERRVAEVDAGVGSRPLVGCGSPVEGARLLIVEPDSLVPCGPTEIGEIWCSGRSVASAYWGQPELSKATFSAYTSTGEGPFLRTGDLGFLDDGELFVTGRLKDLIIIRGRNHYPQDLEATVSSSHPALEVGRCAVFSVEGSEGERLVVVQEVRRSAARRLDAEEVFHAVRSAVSRRHSLQTAAIVLLGPARLPRTTSGKVQRKATRAAYLAGRLDAVAAWGSVDDSPPGSERPPSQHEAPGAVPAEALVDWLWRAAPGELGRESRDHRRLRPSGPVLSRLAERGVLGLRVHSHYGGLGVGALETVRVLEQLSAHDLSLGLFVAYSDALGAGVIERFGSESLRREFLPQLVSGQLSVDFALAEPPSSDRQAGIGAHAAELTDGRWRLSGTKQVLVGLEAAAAVVVFVTHDTATLGLDGAPAVSAFLVSPDAGRVARARSGELVLDGLVVGRNELLGRVGQGLQVANHFLLAFRLGATAVCVGGMKRCAQLARRYSPYYGRGFDSKLTPNPGTLSRLGSLAARVTTLECYVHRLAQALDSGSPVPSLAFSVGKIMGAEMLLNAIDDLMKLGATHWHAETERISQLYRDAGFLRIFDGSPEEVAESGGALLLADGSAHSGLVRALGMGEEGSELLSQIAQAVHARVATLSGPLARRARRWGNTRAGELSVWVLLVAALEGASQPDARPDYQRAALWARAQLRYGLAAVASGTPAETATAEIAEVTEALAVFARSVSGGEAQAERRRDSVSEFPPPLELDTPVEWKGGSEGDLRRWLVGWLAHRARIEESKVDPARSFADYGLDSVAAVELSKLLADKVGVPFDETLLWNFPTINSLLDHLETASARPPPPLGTVALESPNKGETGPSSEDAQDEDFLAGAWEELEAELKRRS